MPEVELETLKHLHRQQREELNYRRSRLYQIFTWTVAILLGTIAVLLRVPDAALANPVWPILGTVFLIALVAFSTRWQSEQQTAAAEHALVIARILGELGAFGTGLYPRAWREEWGKRAPSRRRQLMTLLLGAMTLLILWAKALGGGLG